MHPAAPWSNSGGPDVWRRRAVEPESTIDPWTDVLTVLFPAGLDEIQMSKVRAAVGDSVPTASSARVALGVLDQQTSNSPVTIRWGVDDLAYVDVAGVQLAVDRADASVSIQISEGAYEPHVEATLDQLLHPGDVFVDVGANVGYHAVRGARSVGPGGRVLAVEANPENARLIAHTIARNHITNIELLPVALSGRRGHVVFGSHVGSNGGFLDGASSDSGRGTLVPTFALDDLGLDRVSVVKIDVEGAEALVIDGATETIARDRPSFVMEFSLEMTSRVSQREPREHLDRFVGWGYTIAIIDRATSTPRRMSSVDELLDGWGDFLRIEDLLLVPQESEQPGSTGR
jgi:FkbM family methyltransferase